MFSLHLSAFFRILIALSLTEKSSSSWIPSWFSSTEETSTSTLDKNNKVKRTKDLTTQSRQLLSINDITETFKPLTCTPSSWNCEKWIFGLKPDNVVIKCNECYTLEGYTNNEKISINGTLNIIGRLEIPNGSKVTIETTGIIVQGELDIVSSKIIDGTPDITIQFLGDEDVTFTPDSTNAQVCSGPCELGAKPFVVAGGKVDIRGMPDTNCRTWTTIKDFTTGGKPIPMNIPKWQNTDTCSDSTILSEDFENGLADWYGNAGTNEVLNTHDDSINSGRYLNIANRMHEYQGPMLNLPKDTRECIQPDTDYFFKAMIRIKPGIDHDAATSECHLSQTNCPKLQFSNMEGTGIVRWTELIIMDDLALGFAIKDNEWFEVKQVIKLVTTKTKINPSNIFSFFSINGVEAGIDIALDNVSITPPPPEAFPNATDTCGDLVVNGGADSLDGFPYPAHIYTEQIALLIKKEENGNPYFSVAGRSRTFDAFAIDLTHGCLQTGAVYSFSSRIRIRSGVETKAKITITSKATDESVVLDFVQKECPASSTNIGWITCTGEFTIPDHLSQPKERVRLAIFTQDKELADIDIDDVSFLFKMSGGGGIELQDKDNIANCWAPKSEFLIPSNDLKFDRVQVDKFKTINSTGFVKSATELDRVTTAMDDSDFATELALLSRNIRFVGNESEQKNPSFIVLNTPNIKQIVEGVDFDGFGQEQVVAHYPISFVMSENSGSIVSKNTIRNSMNRCINLKGSNNMVVDGNVAYKTRGHCFAVGSDSTGNTFSNNIGAVTQNAINVIDGQTDNFASTFHIAHPSNTFVGNHAAGSESNGIWFNLPLLQSTLDISTFENNTLHSNKVGIKTYPFGLLSAKTTKWTNIKSYRSDTGISFLKSANIILDDAVLADNRISVDIWQADDISVLNSKITGYSSSFMGAVAGVKDTEVHCKSETSTPITGIRLHHNALNEDSGGTTLTNIAFSGFAPDSGCNPASTGLSMNVLAPVISSYSTSTTFSELTFDGLPPQPKNQVSLCATHFKNVMNVYMVDADGSLNPDGSGAGLIVSSDPSMTNSGTCFVLQGSCAKYCTDVDMSLLGVKTDSPTTTPPTIENLDNTPTLSPVSFEPGLCLLNGNFENSERNWYVLAANMAVVQDGSKAMKIFNRRHQSRGGIWQDINTTCLVLDQWYEIDAKMKLMHEDTDVMFECDPSISVEFREEKTCAAVTLLVDNVLKTVGYTVGPYNNGWNKMYGSFQATQDIISAQKASVGLTGPSLDVDILIDNISIRNQKVAKNCNQPIYNGDAETGDHRGWWLRGRGLQGSIEIVSPGYDNSAYAFKHTGYREDSNYGMIQPLDSACFTAGSKWIITAKFKFFSGDDFDEECSMVNPYHPVACPVFRLWPGNLNSLATKALVNEIEDEMMIGEWNSIKNTFEVTDAWADSGFPETWINVHAAKNFNYIIDDIFLERVS